MSFPLPPPASPSPSVFPARSTALCVADDACFWPWLRWTDFARWPDKARTVVVVPLAGFADWGLGHPLDLEETLASAILREAAQGIAAAPGFRLLTLPPLRFVTGHDPGCAFAAGAPETHRFIEEIVAGVAASGFTRVVLYNASPWNEELIDAAARDIRIDRGLQMFCVNLSGLGYDLHPARGKSRRDAQTLATWLLGVEPDAPAPPLASSPCRPEEETVLPLAGPAATLAEASALGPAMLAEAGRRLCGLLGEIAARPPLAHGGLIRPIRP